MIKLKAFLSPNSFSQTNHLRCGNILRLFYIRSRNINSHSKFTLNVIVNIWLKIYFSTLYFSIKLVLLATGVTY